MSRSQPKALAPEEVVRLVQQIPVHTMVGLRNRALAVFIVGTGLRITEALSLLRSDLDLERKRVLVRCAGKGETRDVPLPGFCLPSLKAWKELRQELGIGDDRPVFTGLREGPKGLRGKPETAPMDPWSVQKYLRRTAEEAGISARVTPEVLRHTFAVRMLKRGCSVPELQRLLGHARVESTRGYVRLAAETPGTREDWAEAAKAIARNSGEQLPRGDQRLTDLSRTQWANLTTSWFICSGMEQGVPSRAAEHQSRFPLSLAKRLISVFTKAGDTVLDPFVGSGTTLVACLELGRHGVGLELSPQYYEAGAEWIEQTRSRRSGEPDLPGLFCHDARRIDELPVGAVDFCLTSPPYWKALDWDDATDGSGPQDLLDLGRLTEYEDYLDAIHDVFAKVGSLLRPGGYVALVLRNVYVPRDKTAMRQGKAVRGSMIPLAWEVAMRLTDLFELRQEMIWCIFTNRRRSLGWPTTYYANTLHHYCIVLQKPGSS